MICVKGHDLYCSYGDTVDLIVLLKGYVFAPEDSIIFTIRGYGGKLCRIMTGIAGSRIPIYFSAEEFTRLPPGRYRYDVVVEQPDGVRHTINFPDWLIIQEGVYGQDLRTCRCM